MFEWFSEPGFVAVAIMTAVTVSKVIGAIWARNDFLALTQAALVVAEDTEISREEKLDLAVGISMATAWYAAPALIIGVPLMVIYVFGKAVALVITGQRVTEAKLLGKFAGQSKYTNLLNKPLWKSKPMVTLWAVLWFLPVAIMLIFAMGSTKLARELARRAALTLFSRVAHH